MNLAETGKYFDFKMAALDPSYHELLKDAGHIALNKFVFNNYLDFKISGINFENNLVFLKNRSSHGFNFVSKASGSFRFDDLKYWQIYLATELINIRYIINLAEEKTDTSKKIHETSTAIYLKPSVKIPLENEKLSQLYGNIHVELQGTSEKSQFRLLVHHYNDRNYNPAYDFESLMIYLFQD